MKTGDYSRVLGSKDPPLWQNKPPLLSHLDMELTERCNFDCVHCYINLPAGNRKARDKELPTARVKAILEEAARLGCLQVRFTGGEPLLRDDFEEIYVFARRLGLKAAIFTNASLITRRLAETLSRITPLEKVEVTVYGMTRAAYEKVTRTPGSFEAAWRGIRLLQDRKVPFVVKGTFLRANRTDAARFERWASGIPWMTDAPAYSQSFNLRSRRDSAKKNRLIKSLRLPASEAVRILTRDKPAFVVEMTDFCRKFAGPAGSRLFSCGAGKGRGCVDAYGRFSPCLLLKAPQASFELSDGSLKEALTGLFPEIRAGRARNPDYLARCARCFLRGLCGQCPARSWMENGTLDSPAEYLCEVAHEKARVLGLLEDGEKAWKIRRWRQRISRLGPTRAAKEAS